MSHKVAEEKVRYGWDLQPIDCSQINFSCLETSLCSTPPPSSFPPNNNYPLLIKTYQPVQVGVRILYKVLYEVQIIKIPFCDQLVSDEVCSKMLQKLNCLHYDWKHFWILGENELNLRLVSIRKVIQEICWLRQETGREIRPFPEASRQNTRVV